jgi:4-carboxymuconolactone decarboxylase
MTEDFAKMFGAWMEQGQKMASAFMPGMENIDAKAFEKFFPPMPKELLEMWFGKTFNPEGLDARTRFLVTIAALTVLGPVGEPQLRMAIKNGLSAGATMQKALEIAQSVFAETPEEKDA